jgi:hypothetical protein
VRFDPDTGFNHGCIDAPTIRRAAIVTQHRVKDREAWIFQNLPKKGIWLIGFAIGALVGLAVGFKVGGVIGVVLGLMAGRVYYGNSNRDYASKKD